jgi:hypothetical protein
LLAYRLALCYQSNRHSTSTTTTPQHEKKHKLNDSLAIANDPTHHLRVDAIPRIARPEIWFKATF